MSKLLFKLRNVPDDEVEEVRQLLDENGIAYFETFAGNWGISMPAIWVHNDEEFERARSLLNEYQQHRASRIREEYRRQQEMGEARTSWQVFRDNPAKFIGSVGLIVIVLYFSLRYFVSFL